MQNDADPYHTTAENLDPFFLPLSLRLLQIFVKSPPRKAFLTRIDSKWPAQLQKLAGDLKFWNQKVCALMPQLFNGNRYRNEFWWSFNWI